VKIAVIGGGGVRTPLLANGLAHSDLPVDEIALFDIDLERLEIIGSVATSFTPLVRTYDDARACVADAAFVILSIRPGGISTRARDEAIAIAHGTVGQETVGAAGFAMAVRNIPHACEYARLVASIAPRAWIINFTNPVGIVTQAMTNASAARVIGICDTPAELFAAVAHVLDLDASRCQFDYFGLNHLGWLREVYCDGQPQLAGVWKDPSLVGQIYATPLFEPAFLRSLRLLPTEYLFYYYRPADALANVRAAGVTRGETIAAMNAQLFRDLSHGDVDRRHVYDAYLRARTAGYMQLESGVDGPIATAPWAAVTGYDKIALNVIRAMHHATNAIIPLNVANDGALRDLNDDDIVEVPSVVNGNGAHPLTVGAVPDSVSELLTRVKEYERLTIEAAAARSTDAAVRALAHNPLVRDAELARTLVNALQPLW
jgi:6-phospho-beta-glucosidase